jgi:hypothetical protein
MLAGARVALVSVAGISVLLSSCSSAPTSAPTPTGSAPPSSPPAVSTEVPTTPPAETVGPTAPPSVAGDWRAARSDAVAAAQLQDVVWTGSQFVAVGDGLDGSGVFLRSPNGRTWKSGSSGGTTAQPYRIASGAGGIVVTGTLDEKTASWHSTDGIHWEYHLKVFPKALGADDVVAVTDVISTPTGWLAVGRDGVGCVV